jgi:hypothetical protein
MLAVLANVFFDASREELPRHLSVAIGFSSHGDSR